MKFSLNRFLMAVSLVLDFVEIDIRGRSTNHSKRVAYAALRIAEKMKFKDEDLYDVVSLAILHDNGICEASNLNDEEYKIEHCTIGENNIVNYPFLKKRVNVIKYHHEAYDGSGFFGLKDSEIPMISQIIFFTDYLENKFELDKIDANSRKEICDFVKHMSGKIFNPEICSLFLEILNNESFILDLKNDFINMALDSQMNEFYLDLSLEEILKVTDIFSRIIDSKSKFTREHSRGIAEKASIMADYYKYDIEQKTKLVIAANLHDLGKLAIPNSILDSPKKLTEDEFYMIKSHTYYTRAALSQIDGFKDITEWASNHHEKLNGAGYPYGKKGDELDFNSRLMGCIDIYQALTEERPYRKPLKHATVMNIMNDMVQGGYIDGSIVSDINFVFSK